MITTKAKSSINHPGASMLKVMIVLMVIAVIFGLFMIGARKLRNEAAKMNCLNNSKQIALAALNYESATLYLPPGAISGPNEHFKIPENTHHSGLIFLCPYIESTPSIRIYRFKLNYSHSENQQLANANYFPYFRCVKLDPNRREMFDNGLTGSVADHAPIKIDSSFEEIHPILNNKTWQVPMPVNGQIKVEEITDGTSQTLLFVEAGGRPAVAWTSPSVPVGIRQIHGGAHPNVTLVSFCDASVKTLKNTFDIKLLAAMATIAGGEVMAE